MSCKNKWTGGVGLPYDQGKKKHEIRDRCWMFLDTENMGHDFSSCELVLKTCYNGIRAK